MINKAMFKQVQTFRRQGGSKASIVKALELDPKTVAKYFAMEEEDYRAYRRDHLFRDKAFDIYRREILEVYEANGLRRLQVASVYDYLEEKYGALPANEQSLRHYIGYLIQTESLRLDESARLYTKVPELSFGKQMQLDFGQYRCRSGLRLYIFAALLSASRFKYVIFQGEPFRTLDVIRTLLEAFDYFGGRPEELVIDQDRLMVVSENAGDIICTKDFKHFIDEQEIGLYVCRRADPESKGKVENLVKFIKGNFLSTRDFETVEEANAGVLRWLPRRANGKISQATKQIPGVLIERERPLLRPLRNSIFRKDSLLGREERTANEKAVVSVKACGYQLPPRYKNKKVEIYTTEDELFVFDLFTGKEIIAYRLSLIPGQLVSRRTCRREGEKTVEELKAAVSGLFELESWKRFSERNFRAFPRYARDQSLEALRFFAGKEVDTRVLERALGYCLENDTPSFTNLKDTYVHFERESRRREPVAVIEVDDHGSHQPLPVSRRQLSEYETAARERSVS
ncbi:MAG TPA: DDE-type integrase/transposase/recombinase [Spirochaetia bacterium]|nr:DDE-type integrase/transposase/recombinase [Spirochaetia bacterium]